MDATAAPVKPQKKEQQHHHHHADHNRYFKIAGLLALGFFAARVLASTPAPIATQPTVAAAPAATAPAPTPAPQPVIQQAPVIVQQPQPIIIQQPTVTILKPQETIVIQKSYPNRTIVIESSPTVLVQ